MGLHEFQAETERIFAERQAEFEQIVDSMGISRRNPDGTFISLLEFLDKVRDAFGLSGDEEDKGDG